jgi:hypothetical protein
MFNQADRIQKNLDEVYNPQKPAADRAANGQFKAGNQEACGNPFGRRVAQLRSILMQTVTDGDFAEIAQMLIDKAKKGDLAATRLLLSYTLGKPSPTVDPDRVAIDEWEIHQEKAVAAPEMEELFAKVSVKEANCMANIAWPCSIYDNFTQQFLSDEQKKTGIGAMRVEPSTTDEITIAPPASTPAKKAASRPSTNGSNGRHRPKVKH